jgi:hypothetical protein
MSTSNEQRNTAPQVERFARSLPPAAHPDWVRVIFKITIPKIPVREHIGNLCTGAGVSLRPLSQFAKQDEILLVDSTVLRIKSATPNQIQAPPDTAALRRHRR